MTPDIELLAKEAGLMWGGDDGCKYLGSGRYDCERELAKFAALIAEECAKVCAAMPYDKPQENRFGSIYIHVMGPKDCAAAIRAKFALGDKETK